jgi:hypothetical protein
MMPAAFPHQNAAGLCLYAGQWQGRTIKADGFNFTCLLAASKGMK